MTEPNSIEAQVRFLLQEADRVGAVATSWSITDLDLGQLREEVGDDQLRFVLRNLPFRADLDDSAPLTLNMRIAVPQQQG